MPGVIYAATVGGLHRSTDGGETWSRISRESLVVTALEVDRSTGRLFVGTEGEGTFTSDDAGTTLMIDGDAIIKAADAAGICIVGRSRR